MINHHSKTVLHGFKERLKDPRVWNIDMKHVPKILEMNDLGFYTFDSSAGLSFIDNETSMNERSNVIGKIHKDIFPKFKDFLKKYPYIVLVDNTLEKESSIIARERIDFVDKIVTLSNDVYNNYIGAITEEHYETNKFNADFELVTAIDLRWGYDATDYPDSLFNVICLSLDSALRSLNPPKISLKRTRSKRNASPTM